MKVTFNRAHARLLLASTLATGLVAAVLTVPSYELSNTQSLADTYEETRPVRADDGHWHVHDAERKNDVSQAEEMDAEEGSALRASIQDPTTPEQAQANTEAVARDRDASQPPELVPADFTTPRQEVPEDRYAVAGGCYDLDGAAITFRATDLGVHLLYTTEGTFLTAPKGRTAVTTPAKPSLQAEWITEKTDQGFTFQLEDGRYLARDGDGLVAAAEPTHFALRTTTGCTAYPEVEVNVTGEPHAGTTPYQEVRGYVDAHVHGMAFQFLGGEIHCGRPWHKYGAAYALPDCSDLTQQGTKGAPLDLVLSGQFRDPVGWPTFADWPAPDALTHEGTYYKWMERSWRGGQRIFVNLLVENGQLCNLYPLKRNSCDDMTSAKLQAQDMRDFERYVDAQYGGPGKGWYRIVTDPFEARQVINEGKLAVVMGIEVSIPFGCTMFLDIPQCDQEQITTQLDELHELGVRQMELVNKFDNALAGVAGDEGAIGPLVNLANFLETGTFWNMKHCEPADGESADKTQLALPTIDSGVQDALFGALVQVAGLGLPALPLYGRPMHCNQRGLTDLGAFTVDLMMERNMLIDPDHMSVKARQATLDQVEAAGYSGVVSSHSWSTPDAYPRIYALGGFVAPMAGDSSGFFEKWQRHLGWADDRYYFGFGFGADINGLAEQASPRGADVENPVSYPFTGLNGITIDQQVSGERVYDINVDGVSHYGLYPDWVEDLRQIGGPEAGEAIVEDLARGAEAYLQTWERAYHVAPDSCRNPELQLTPAEWDARVSVGMTTPELMQAVGQPWVRRGSTYTYCAKAADGDGLRVEVTVDAEGQVDATRVTPTGS